MTYKDISKALWINPRTIEVSGISYPFDKLNLRFEFQDEVMDTLTIEEREAIEDIFKMLLLNVASTVFLKELIEKGGMTVPGVLSELGAKIFEVSTSLDERLSKFVED